jgi:hypothetical protein
MDRPILFNGEMVQAILDERKTQTRRIIKPQPDRSLVLGDTLKTWTYDPDGKPCLALAWRDLWSHPGMDLAGAAFCPYGAPGDRLWVRETWIADPPHDDTWDYYLFSDGAHENFDALPERYKNPKHVIHRASWSGPDLRWRPSIFMPRWASRITLEVVNVRVERVQEIGRDDAIAEGMMYQDTGKNQWGNPRPSWTWNKDHLGSADDCLDTPQFAFGNLWNEVNEKRSYPWEVNPFVWVIEFRRVE